MDAQSRALLHCKTRKITIQNSTSFNRSRPLAFSIIPGSVADFDPVWLDMLLQVAPGPLAVLWMIHQPGFSQFRLGRLARPVTWEIRISQISQCCQISQAAQFFPDYGAYFISLEMPLVKLGQFLPDQGL